jgi:DNA-binding MarR family transcriptional regulator
MTEFDHTRLDDLIHSKLRLAVMAILATVDRAEFTFLRDQTNTSDGNLSLQLAKLEEAGYVKRTMRLAKARKKAVSDYSLTRKGREAFEAYLDNLNAMLQARRSKEK